MLTFDASNITIGQPNDSQTVKTLQSRVMISAFTYMDALIHWDNLSPPIANGSCLFDMYGTQNKHVDWQHKRGKHKFIGNINTSSIHFNLPLNALEIRSSQHPYMVLYNNRFFKFCCEYMFLFSHFSAPLSLLSRAVYRIATIWYGSSFLILRSASSK